MTYNSRKKINVAESNLFSCFKFIFFSQLNRKKLRCFFFVYTIPHSVKEMSDVSSVCVCVFCYCLVSTKMRTQTPGHWLWLCRLIQCVFFWLKYLLLHRLIFKHEPTTNFTAFLCFLLGSVSFRQEKKKFEFCTPSWVCIVLVKLSEEKPVPEMFCNPFSPTHTRASLMLGATV